MITRNVKTLAKYLWYAFIIPAGLILALVEWRNRARAARANSRATDEK